MIANKEIQINDQYLKKAYLLLKRDLYYDTADLFKRHLFSEFESNPEFENELEVYTKQILDLLNGGIEFEFNEWLKNISIKLLPKEVENIILDDDKNHNGTFLSNYRKRDDYKISKINYFFYAPIPIYIISMLWVLTIGKILDEKIDDRCLGNRLTKFNNIESDLLPQNVFKLYFSQYSKWRDKAIEVGLNDLKSGKNILLIALDIKECFYRVPINWDEIEDIIRGEKNIDQNKYLSINNLLKKIHHTFVSNIKEKIKKTHNLVKCTP